MVTASTTGIWQRLVVLLAMSMMVSGCARYAITDYDGGADFSQYRSYSIEKRSEGRIQSLDATRIERAVQRELSERGLDQSDNGADLKVRYTIEDEKRLESRGPNVGLGFGFGRSPFGFGVAHSPVRTREIREGKLVVQLVEAESQRVVWQGTGQRNLTENMSPDSRSSLIDRVVREMFKDFPPQ